MYIKKAKGIGLFLLEMKYEGGCTVCVLWGQPFLLVILVKNEGRGL